MRKLTQQNDNQQQQRAPTYFQNSPEQLRGAQLAQPSMILGILSLFVVGTTLGPIAISTTKQAEQLHTAATVGKVAGLAGLAGTILLIISTISFVFVMVTVFSASMA